MRHTCVNRNSVRRGYLWSAVKRCRAARAAIEAVEDRLLLSTYCVTTLLDGPGTLVPAGGGNYYASTLRAAITAANAHAGTDEITFLSSLSGSINLTSDLPAISSPLYVYGPGSSKVTVQPSSSDGEAPTLFVINAGQKALISGLTLANGAGGIINNGNLTVSKCVISGNSAINGAGIYNTGTLAVNNSRITKNDCGNDGAGLDNTGNGVLTNSVVSDNTGFINGGGICNSGQLAMFGCTLSGNFAKQGAGLSNISGDSALTNCVVLDNTAEYIGGGVVNSSGKLSVVLSTLSGNHAIYGGGIENESAASVVGCTLSGNSVTANFMTMDGGTGGGIDNTGTLALADSTFSGNMTNGVTTGLSGVGGFGAGTYNSGTCNIANCTFSGNVANGVTVSSPMHYVPGGGGGIDNTSSGALRIDNSIVAGNTANSHNDDIDGSLNHDSSYNITTISAGLTNGVYGNKVGVSLAAVKLGPLAGNGGPTQTMALLAGSPALGAGNPLIDTADKIFADQRGLPRIVGGQVDIGAYETQPAAAGSIAGTVYDDINQDGIHEASEPGLGAWQVYIDGTNAGVYIPGDVTTFTNSNGTYKFTGLPAGTYIVREVPVNGWSRTEPAAGDYVVVVNLSVAGGAVTGKDFGNFA